MKRWLRIQWDPIDEAALAHERTISRGIGAVIYFLGVVREREGEANISAIDYEAFEKMAARQFEKIFEAVERRWPIESVRVVHRIGCVHVNEPSLWIEVTAPHRGEAFAACQFIIDEMKKVVPIWKRPITETSSANLDRTARPGTNH
ncbi:MAG TPA: molybdenum cofactor biosynthesis protein MoaE [Verrucomicrobiae bacterium]